VTDYLAFQEFTPHEQHDGRCIWCGYRAAKNKEHLISRKLTLTSHQSTVLRYNVCQGCNAKCGRIEDWVLRNSPLGWTRFFHYLSSNRGSDSGSIPSYFYSDYLSEWLVYRLDGRNQHRTIESQLIVKNDGCLTFITEERQSPASSVLRRALTSEWVVDVRPSLPEDFSPRVLFDGTRAVAIARTKELTDILQELVGNNDWRLASLKAVPIQSTKHRQHFKWSKDNWIKFCAKISHETLCLFEGSGCCLRPDFERVRSYVLGGVSSHYREVVFDEHGPIGAGDMPTVPECVDISVGQDCPMDFIAVSPHVSPGMHQVILYEMDGWICSSVSVSGFPACSIVLAGPNAHLKDLYSLTYDDKSDAFHTLRLAYDRRLPIVPLPVVGHAKDAILRTYGLKPA